jgi:transporter family-2 protein
MSLFSYLFVTFLGIVLAVHLAMNGQVGAIVENPRMGNALFWCIGAITAVLVGVTGWDSNFFSRVAKVPPYLFIAGAMGACLVFAIAWIVPQVGPRALFITLIAGQVLGGMALSQFGLLGSAVQPASMTNILGAIVMIAGVYLSTK